MRTKTTQAGTIILDDDDDNDNDYNNDNNNDNDNVVV
jgi:hypothetical protein